MLRDSLERVRRRIDNACRRCGRPASAVTLIGVTKGVPVDTIRDALALGLREIGENRVQEARAKHLALGSRLQAVGSSLGPRASSLEPVRWHLIGHLQRNKAKEAVTLFDALHSVDSVALAEGLERQLGKRAQGSGLRAQGSCPQPPGPSPEPTLEVFIQVSVSGEATKFGCAPEESEQLARAILQCRHLRLAGLMTIAPFASHPEFSRPIFRQLRQLRDSLTSTFRLSPSTLHLSMGMSQDFEVAIEEGADLVRIGTAIFGARPAQTRDQRPETRD